MTRKGCWLLVLALAGPGCLTPAPHLEEEAKKMPPVPTAPAPPPRAVITPEQVTEANAPQMAQALGREMDQEERPAARPLPPTETKESVSKP